MSAMGQGANKVNAIYQNYFAGLTDDWKVEFVARPIIASVMEYSSPEIVMEFIKYGVNLNLHYEGGLIYEWIHVHHYSDRQ